MVKRNGNKQGRPTPIRVTKNDIQEYKRLARNSKAKIKRTLKNYGVDLTGEINIPEMQEFKTRKEFNKWKDDVKKFTNRGNDKYQFKKNKYGVVASVAEINEIKKATKKAQKIAKKIEKENAAKPFMSGGQDTGTLGQRQQLMGKPNVGGIYVPPDFDFEKMNTKRRLDLKKQSMLERSDPKFLDKRQVKMKENYIKGIEENFNSLGDDVVKMVKSIPADDFFEMFLTNDELEFSWIYTEEDVEAHVERIKSVLEKYFSGNVNLDLKGF